MSECIVSPGPAEATTRKQGDGTMDTPERQGRREPRTVGLDAHPDSFTASILEGKIPLEATVLKTSDKQALPTLETWIEKNTSPQDVVVMEASANTFTLVERIEACGRTVLVLESTQLGKVCKQYCVTDKISAVRIARAYLGGMNDKVWVPDAETRRRRDIFSAHQQAVRDFSRAVSRLKSYLNEYTVRMPKGVPVSSPKGEVWIMAREWESHQRMLLEDDLADMRHAQERRVKLRKIMAAEILRTPALLRMVRIFGLRHITVYALAAYIGKIERFRSPKKLVAYIGLQPWVKGSGEKTVYGSLTGGGRRDLRSLLIEAAHCVFRYRSQSNPLHRWAWSVHFRRGRNIAVVAVARKMVTALWYLLMGMFTPLTERTPHLQRKIRILAGELGIKAVKEMGFRRYQDFVLDRIKIIQEVT
jgi:transposase